MNTQQAQRRTQREAAVQKTVARVRQIESTEGVSTGALEHIKQALVDLAARRELFPLEDFPLPVAAADRNNALYRLSEDDDHRFALYLQVSRGDTHTPAHDHTTWAVIVGLAGEELNRRYVRDDALGVRETGSYVVGPGSGIAFMPDDLHSIHIDANHTVINFHMYGLALEQLHERHYYDPARKTWKHFPASSGIRPAP